MSSFRTSMLKLFDATVGALACHMAGRLIYWAVSAAGDVIIWGTQWGWPGADTVSGDYNGDGISDLAVYDQGCDDQTDGYGELKNQ